MATTFPRPDHVARSKAQIPASQSEARPRVVAAMALAQLGLFLALLTPVFSSLAIKVQDIVPSDVQVSALGLVSSLGALAALTASVADQVPAFKRGKVAGLIGVMQNLAILGAAYAAKVLGTDTLLLFMIPATVGLVLVVLYAIALPDTPLPRRSPSTDSRRTALKTFWVNPRKHPDFAWAFVSRFMIILAMFMFTTFRLLYLQDQLGLPNRRAVTVMATGVLVYTLVLMVAGQLAGWLSDRLQRRKAFVSLSAVVFAIGTALLITTQSVAAFYLAEGVLGLGFGVYAGVDLALVLDVLPDPEDSAKDLGVFNIANAAPQSIAPALGALLVNHRGSHEYHLLLGAAATICTIGALAVIPIKKVR